MAKKIPLKSLKFVAKLGVAIASLVAIPVACLSVSVIAVFIYVIDMLSKLEVFPMVAYPFLGFFTTFGPCLFAGRNIVRLGTHGKLNPFEGYQETFKKNQTANKNNRF